MQSVRFPGNLWNKVNIKSVSKNANILVLGFGMCDNNYGVDFIKINEFKYEFEYYIHIAKA